MNMKEYYLIFTVLLLAACVNEQETKDRSLRLFTDQDLRKELMARHPNPDKSATDTLIPLNDLLSRFTDKMLFDEIREREDVIYGADNRKDIYQIADTGVVKNSATIVGFFRKSDLVFFPDKSVALRNKITLKSIYSLCNDEPFCNQYIGPYCTGFAVSSKLIASAGHCMKGMSLDDFVCIFGYRLNSVSDSSVRFTAEQVYYPESVINGLTTQSKDYLLVTVKGTIPASRISAIDKKEVAMPMKNIYVIGHPCGLPIKVADNAEVRNNDNPDFFVTNLDTYKGNSGSPVYSSLTNQVIGILVGGEHDFQTVPVENCVRSYRCSNIGCRGESVTRIKYLLPHLSTP